MSDQRGHGSPQGGVLHHYYRKNGLPWRNWIFGTWPLVSAGIGHCPGFQLLHARRVRTLAEMTCCLASTAAAAAPLAPTTWSRLDTQATGRAGWDAAARVAVPRTYELLRAGTGRQGSTFSVAHVRRGVRHRRRRSAEPLVSWAGHTFQRHARPAVTAARHNVERSIRGRRRASHIVACEPSCILTIKTTIPPCFTRPNARQGPGGGAGLPYTREFLLEGLAR